MKSTYPPVPSRTPEDKEPGTVGKTAKSEVLQGTPISVDPHATSLPMKYRGDDIVKAYKEVSKRVPGKDKYETTEEFDERVRLSGVEDNIYAFLVEKVKCDYNADKREFTAWFDIDVLRLFTISRGISNAVTVHTIENGKKHTMESNAFGVTVDVLTHSGIRYKVALANELSIYQKRLGLPYSNKIQLMRYHIKIGEIYPDEAEKMQKSLKVMLICKPHRSREWILRRGINTTVSYTIKDSDPFYEVGLYGRKSDFSLTGETIDYTSARIDHPIRNSYSVKYINADLLEVWAYDSISGTIYIKDRLH